MGILHQFISMTTADSAGFWPRFWKALKDGLFQRVAVDQFGERIQEAIRPHILGSVDIAGHNLLISDALVATWGVMILLFVVAWLLGSRTDPLPTTRRQLLGEVLVDTLLKLCRDAGLTVAQAEQTVPFIGTIGLFVMFANLTSVIGIPPPSKNIGFPVALALVTILYVIISAIRFVGLSGFWRSLTYPRKMLLPFKLLDYVIKPTSLALRLFGNVFGAFILMEFIYLVMPVILPGIVGLWFDVADGILQAVIFTYLAITYLGEIVEGAQEHEDQAVSKKTADPHEQLTKTV